MESSQKVVVIFPGAWSRGVVELWLKFVIEFFTNSDYRVVIMRYEGTTIREMVDACCTQLEELDITEGALGVAYSMGGIPLRMLARDNPKLFNRVILLASTTQYGLPFWGYIRGVLTIPWEFLRGFVTGNVTLDTQAAIIKAFFNWRQRGEGHAWMKACEALKIMRPEPMACCLKLVPLPLFHGNTGPLRCRVVAVVPHEDLLFKSARYQDDDVRVLDVFGDHGFVFDSSAVEAHLRRCMELID